MRVTVTPSRNWMGLVGARRLPVKSRCQLDGRFKSSIQIPAVVQVGLLKIAGRHVVQRDAKNGLRASAFRKSTPRRNPANEAEAVVDALDVGDGRRCAHQEDGD